jgi:putative NADPH-quinone reductase
MKILVILGHPDPGSFNHAIEAAVCHALKPMGHTVTAHDLYAEGFNPLLTKEEIAGQAMPEEIKKHCEDLAAADGIIVVHPNWRDQPPAIVKGWVDRVFRVGVAFGYEGEKGEQGIPVGLLKAEHSLILTTSDCPSLSHDPLENFWEKSTLGACGVKTVNRKNLGGVVFSDDKTRMNWLDEVAKTAQQLFPAGQKGRAD